MFEMLSGGRPPFDGHILEVMSARTARDIPRVSERFPELEVPYELEDIVARLTRRRPADRYDGAHEVIEALDAVRLGRQAGTPTERISQRRSRRRWLVAAVLAAGAGGAALWFAVDRPAAVAIAEEEPDPAAPPPGAEQPAGAPAPAAGDPAPAAGDPAALAGGAAAVAGASAPRADDRAPAAADEPPATAAPPPARNRHRPRAGRPAAHAAAAAAAPASPASVEARRSAPAPAIDPPGEPPPAAQAAALATAARPAPPRALRATIDSVDVTGSLPRGDVQRAVERRWSAIARCLPAAPDTVTAHFTIGEARRALGVRATGATPQLNACITAALVDVRTEAAPDVGDVEVTVRIAFAVKT